LSDSLLDLEGAGRPLPARSREGSSYTTAKITDALVKAQAAYGPVETSGTNPHFRSRYATIGDLWNASRDALAGNGLAVSQTFQLRDGVLLLVSKLLHVSGEWLASELPLELLMKSAHATGSAVSYARRYSLSALLGLVVGEEDDDGNAAVGLTKPAPEYRMAEVARRGPGRPPKESPEAMHKRMADMREKAKAKREAEAKPEGPFPEPSEPEDDLMRDREEDAEEVEPEWLDSLVGFGKHKERDWRWFLDGSPGGQRETYLKWISSIDPTKAHNIKQAEQVQERVRYLLERRAARG